VDVVVVWMASVTVVCRSMPCSIESIVWLHYHTGASCWLVTYLLHAVFSVCVGWVIGDQVVASGWSPSVNQFGQNNYRDQFNTFVIVDRVLCLVTLCSSSVLDPMHTLQFLSIEFDCRIYRCTAIYTTSEVIRHTCAIQIRLLLLYMQKLKCNWWNNNGFGI